jgi:hypothetical protein
LKRKSEYEYIRVLKGDKKEWEELSAKTRQPIASLFRFALNSLRERRPEKTSTSSLILLNGEESTLTLSTPLALKRALRKKAEELGVSLAVLGRVILADWLSKPLDEDFLEKILLFSGNRIRGKRWKQEKKSEDERLRKIFPFA